MLARSSPCFCTKLCCLAELPQAENEALRQQLRKSESLRRKSHRALLELQQARGAGASWGMHAVAAERAPCIGGRQMAFGHVA